MKCLYGRYELKGMVIEVDFVMGGIVYYRTWSAGSRGTRRSDYGHFLGAWQMDVEKFQKEVGEGR